MPAPRQEEPLYDPNGVAYGDPVLSTATVTPIGMMPNSSKTSGPDVIYSPDYIAQRTAEKRAQTPLGLPSIMDAIKSGGVKPSQNPIMDLATPANPTVRDAALGGAPMPVTEPAKKPNYLLWGAIAVGGFFIVRKFLK